MKALFTVSVTLLLVCQTSFARQLQGVAAENQEIVAEQLQVSKSKVKAWSNGKFKVYDSSLGANDSQRDGMICSGTLEFLDNDDLVIGNLSECLSAVAKLEADKQD